jgi:transposase
MRDFSCGDMRIFLEVEVRWVECRRCGKVKQERLDFLADNPFYTKRFAYYVGQRCRAAPIKDVAKDLALDWHTVKALDKQYMEPRLKRVGTPGPQVIGVDEISIRKGHDYRKGLGCGSQEQVCSAPGPRATTSCHDRTREHALHPVQ